MSLTLIRALCAPPPPGYLQGSRSPVLIGLRWALPLYLPLCVPELEFGSCILLVPHLFVSFVCLPLFCPRDSISHCPMAQCPIVVVSWCPPGVLVSHWPVYHSVLMTHCPGALRYVFLLFNPSTPEPAAGKFTVRFS